MYKLTFRHSGTSPEGRRCLWMRPRRNYAKHSFVPSTEATCALTCEKNTNKTQHSQNRRMNTKTRICTLDLYIFRAEFQSYPHWIPIFPPARTIPKSEYSSVRGRVIVTNVTYDFYITRDSFKRTILVWSRIPRHIPVPKRRPFIHEGSSRFEREAHFDVKNAQCWEREREPRVSIDIYSGRYVMNSHHNT